MFNLNIEVAQYAFIVLLIIFVYQLIKLLHKKFVKKAEISDGWKDLLPIFSLMVSVLALINSTSTIIQSNKDREAQETRYKKQEEKNEQQRLKDSIQQKTLSASKDFLESMNTTFAKVNTSMDKVSSKLDVIPGQINNISGSFKSLTETSQKTYSIMFEEYMQSQKQIAEQKDKEYRETLKRPKISLLAIECEGGNPSSIFLANDGDAPALIPWLSIEIPEYIEHSERLDFENVSAERTIVGGKIRFKILNVGVINENTTIPYKITWNIINPVTTELYVNWSLFYSGKNANDTLSGHVLVCSHR